MLSRRVIPCLDVANGRVVKGTSFVDLVDEGDPVELAAGMPPREPTSSSISTSRPRPEGRGTLLELVERTARSRRSSR